MKLLSAWVLGELGEPRECMRVRGVKHAVARNAGFFQRFHSPVFVTSVMSPMVWTVSLRAGLGKARKSMVGSPCSTVLLTLDARLSRSKGPRDWPTPHSAHSALVLWSEMEPV